MKKIISGLLISSMLLSAASAFAAEEKTPGACGNIKIETSINGTTVTTSTDANGKLITTTTDGAKDVKEDAKKDETEKDETEKAETFFEKYFRDYIIKMFIAYINENPEEVRRLLDETTKSAPTVESAETVK